MKFHLTDIYQRDYVLAPKLISEHQEFRMSCLAHNCGTDVENEVMRH